MNRGLTADTSGAKFLSGPCRQPILEILYNRLRSSSRVWCKIKTAWNHQPNVLMQKFGKFLHQPDLEDPIVTCGHPKTDKIVEIGNGGSCRVTWISCGRASMAKSAKASADLTTFPVVLAMLWRNRISAEIFVNIEEGISIKYRSLIQPTRSVCRKCDTRTSTFCGREGVGWIWEIWRKESRQNLEEGQATKGIYHTQKSKITWAPHSFILCRAFSYSLWSRVSIWLVAS